MHIAELLCLPGSPHSELSDTTAQVVTSECWGGEDLWGELGSWACSQEEAANPRLQSWRSSTAQAFQE